jgi:Holliday junction resolvase RusA-like endonuclease
MITLTLPLAPSVNALWRISGSRMYRTKQYKDWAEEAGWMIRQQTKESIEGPYALHIRALKTKKRRDLDNILKATSDLLVEMRVVEDDSLCLALAAEWSTIGTEPMIVTLHAIGETNDDDTGNYDLQ